MKEDIKKVMTGEAPVDIKKSVAEKATPPAEYKKLEPDQYFAEKDENFVRVHYQTPEGKEIEEHQKEIRPGVWQKTGEVKIEAYMTGLKSEKQRTISWAEIPTGVKDRHILFEAEQWNETTKRWEKIPGTRQDMGLESNSKKQ